MSRRGLSWLRLLSGLALGTLIVVLLGLKKRPRKPVYGDA